MIRTLLLIIAVLLLAGCSQQDIARAQAAQAKAEAILAQTEAARAQAEQSLADIQAIAVQVGGDKAAALIAAGQVKLALAEQAVHAAQLAAGITGQAVTASAQTQAAGGSSVQVVVSGISALLLGVLATVAKMKPQLNQANASLEESEEDLARHRTALALTAKHADRMEEAETEGDVKAAKMLALVEQNAVGVHGVISAARAA